MMPHTLENLEIHASHACNLACESCSHFSNHAHSGVLSLEEASEWMEPWSVRLRPKQFSILGGEPTLNPDLVELVLLCRRYWPDALLRVVTNGFFLHRHPDLPKVISRDGNAVIQLSVHHDSATYLDAIAPHVQLFEDWIRQYGLSFRVSLSHEGWTRRYRGFGHAMEPFEDGNIRASWEHCPSRLCRQVFEGKLWKCSPIAYLRLQDGKYELSERWRPYLAYQPLRSDCSDAELSAFIGKQEEPICAMCPAEPQRIRPGSPLRRFAAAPTDGGGESGSPAVATADAESHWALQALRRLAHASRRTT